MTLVAELKQVITRRLEIASSDEIIEIVSQLAAAEQPVPFSFKNSPRAQDIDAFAPRFIKGEGIVSDAQTGLIWAAEDVGAGQRYSWEEAKKAAAALSLGGFSDWRLPTIRELLTLVDYERSNPAIDTDAFPSCKTDWYWTSTPLASSPGDDAWGVGFGPGAPTGATRAAAVSFAPSAPVSSWDFGGKQNLNAQLQDVGQIDRQTYLGGSDIAGVLGLSPWATRVSVWQRKTHAPTPETSGPKVKRLNRGKLWEQVVGEMLVAKLEARDHKVKVLSANHRYVDPDVPYFAAEIDYEIQLDDIAGPVNVELKTVHPNATREWGEEDTDECPVWYAAQAMWGLGITRRKCCIVAPLFGADEIRVYPIVADDATIAGMREQARLFWELHVLANKAPEPESLADVNRLFKMDAERTVIAEPWLIEKLLRYRAIEAEIEARAAERDVLEFEVKRFMGDATAITLPGQEKPAVTWKSRANAHLDQAALKEAYPNLHAQFLRRGSSRVFEVKKFRTE